MFLTGKLEALAILLQKLKSEGRRVLILSQMVLMLDILEMFLNFHYLTYVRIDENANSEQRQELMRSFNRDRRIFCALLSTHSRATGINLVEADTVVFYDNDLNPVMDAKAQEWCDRIGRCKDIHIYRLVSGNSIEEKLLKNGTKDLIREVAAQGNDYSMAFLTQRTIQELFEVYSPMDDAGFPVKAEEFVVLSQEPSVSETIAPKIARPFIEALKSIECLEEDAQRSTEEAVPGSSTVAVSSDSDGSRYDEEPSQLEELADFMEQLTPIEKYALNYLELFHTTTEQEKERSSEEYVYEDADGQTEVMPLWTPPTPPQDDNDIYIDSVMCLMYETTPIPEAKLPPVYVRKERKRHKTDPSAAGRKKKQRHGEAVVPPRSLFDRATPGMLKIRREGKEQKKNLLLKQQTPFAKPLPTYVKSSGEPAQDSPDWLIGEDWALLQAVKQLLELPLNLTIVSPAHTPNWDLVSDVVNSCSRIYRSSKQCRNRYENVIIPREEGKSKNNRPLRTSQIYAQDENATHTQLYTSHFELMKMTAGKRSPPIKPLLGMNPFQKNPKHASVLAESGINYDKPLPPIQVASLRAERIAKEKKAGTIKTSVTGTSIPTGTVSGNVIVNTIAGVPATFQSINKRLASPVAPGALTTSGGSAPAQVVHTQQRAVGSPATATTDLVSMTTTQGVRAVTSVTASAVVTTNLTPVQTPTRSLVTQVSQGTHHQDAETEDAAATTAPTTTGPARTPTATSTSASADCTAPTAAAESSAHHSHSPTAWGFAHRHHRSQPPGGPAWQTVVAQPVHVQQLLKLKQQAVQQQKAIQPQVAQGQAAVQQKLTTQQITTQGPQQKVAYAAQPALKTQFLTTPISQAQKLAGTQQVQTQIQVAKLPQVVQQQTPVASIQQVASASQQASPQTVTLTQATAAGQQVQMIPTVTATAQVVQQKLIQQQVVTTASASLQTPGGPSPAQLPTSSDSPNQQPKLQMRVPAVRLKTPTKPPCQ